MKLQQVNTVVLFGAITLILAPVLNHLPAHAQSTTFACGTSKGSPATLAYTARGSVPVIRWTSDYFSQSGWKPQQRCEEVSKRFQEYHQRNEMNFLTTGMMNNQSVVCTTDREGGSCMNLLFTLKPGSSAGQTLRNLLAVRVRARTPLNESPARVYIDMKEYLNTAPVEGSVSSKSTVDLPATPSQPSSVSPSESSTNRGLW